MLPLVDVAESYCSNQRRMIGASDLDGYASTVVTEGTAGGNVVVVVDERRAGVVPCDFFNSTISERRVSSSARW